MSGCKGYVLIWDFASGRVKSDIALSKSLTKRKGKRGRLLQKSSLVWTIKMLADGTIVTGDSEGNLSLWDLETATLKTQFNTHKGPILALCVAADEEVGRGKREIGEKFVIVDLSGSMTHTVY